MTATHSKFRRFFSALVPHALSIAIIAFILDFGLSHLWRLLVRFSWVAPSRSSVDLLISYCHAVTICVGVVYCFVGLTSESYIKQICAAVLLFLLVYRI